MTRTQKLAVGCFVGAPILCCLGGLLWVQYQINSAGGELGKELASAKAKGLKVEPEELARHLPPEQNAAEEYKHALSLMPDGSDALKDVTVVGRAIPATKDASAKDLAGAKRAYPQIANILRLVEQGSDKPHLEFQRDWRQGPALMFPEYAGLKGIVKALGYKAKLQSDQGDWQGALKTLARMQRIGRHVGEEPTLIGMLVQVAIEAITTRQLQYFVRDNSHNEAALAGAEKVLAEYGPLPNFRYALNGEMVLGRVAVQGLGKYSLTELSGGSDQQTNTLDRFLTGNPALKRAFEARLVHEYNWEFEHLPAKAEDWEQATQVGAELEQRIEADRSPFNTLNRVLFPVFTQATMTVGRTVAGRRLSACMINLCQGRNRTGSFPAKLPEYGEMGIDPFSGKPFVYRRSKIGFLLYSIGEDRKDDGGVMDSSSGKREIAVEIR